MPKYIVRVTCKYPVTAVNPEDALSTVPMMVHIRRPADGLTEIVDALTEKVALTAELPPDKGRK